MRIVLTNFAVALALPLAASQPAFGQATPSVPPAGTSSNMTCPSSLSAGTKVQVELPSRHGPDFGIQRPTGEVLLVSFDPPDPQSEFQPPFANHRFLRAGAITFKAEEVEGLPPKSAVAEKVFTVPGNYIVLIAVSLETEDPDIQGFCVINYVGPGS